MRLLQQSSTAQVLMFLMVDSTDHISGKTGLSPTVTLSKNGGSFASPSGAVSEVGNGYYKVAGNATDTATLGPLILHATASGADPTDIEYQVVAFDPLDVVRLGLTALPNVAQGNTGQLATGNASGQVTVATNNDKTGYSLATAPPTANTIADTIWGADTTTPYAGGTYGNTTFGRRVLRGSTTQAEVQVTGSNHVSADVHAFQAAVINNAAFAADALAATNFAASVGQEFADAILGRNIAGGSDGGRMVKDALRFLRNRFAVSSGTLTVYQEDDTTAAWTATVTGDAAANPIVESNPA